LLDLVEHLEENVSDVLDLRSTYFSFLQFRNRSDDIFQFVVVIIEIVLDVLDLISEFLGTVHQLLESTDVLLLLSGGLLRSRVV
jgi:hypothetical protein